MLAVDNMFAYYNFETLDDNIVLDQWGNRDGSNTGAKLVEGKSGMGLEISQNSDQVVFDDNTLGDSWTVGYWVKNTNTRNERISVLESKDGERSFNVKMGIGNSTSSAGVHVGSAVGMFLTYYTIMQDNAWTHMTWTQSKEAGLTLYLNGELVANNAWTRTNAFQSPIDVIGGRGFTGIIDELKVYDKVLNQSEIQEIILTDGLNLNVQSKELYVEDSFQIETNLVSGQSDKTVSFESLDPSIASVNAEGLVTGLKKGVTKIKVSNKASAHSEFVTIRVNKHLNMRSSLTQYDMDSKHVTVMEKDLNNEKGRSYLGHPDMVQLADGTLITAYPIGHGKGPLIMQISKDGGETWVEKTDTPASWTGSQETPTLNVLNLEDGTERIMMVTGLPDWGVDNDGNRTGWNSSYSDDGGETWTEYTNWYPILANGDVNRTIVAMASMIQLKDEKGEFIQKWMGIYHNYQFVNYKTYLTFDENGKEQWSEPEPYLSNYRVIEAAANICEVGMFRSPDGSRIVALSRTNSRMHKSLMFYSDDEGVTWSNPEEVQGSLQGDRHIAVYDPISERLVITFREVNLDTNENGIIEAGDHDFGDWILWVGTYDDIMEQNPGEYRVTIAKNYKPGNDKFADTGYAGAIVREDGTFVMNSYGRFDETARNVSYIKQAKFKLGELDNSYDLVTRKALDLEIAKSTPLIFENYADDSLEEFHHVLAKAKTMSSDQVSQQVEVDAMTENLKDAHDKLVLKSAYYSKLHELIDAFDAMDHTEYTEASVNSVVDFIETLDLELKANEQKIVDDYVANLSRLIAGLKKVEEPGQPGDDGKPGVDGQPGTEGKPGTDGMPATDTAVKDSSKLPATGIASASLVTSVASILAGVYLVFKKKD